MDINTFVSIISTQVNITLVQTFIQYHTELLTANVIHRHIYAVTPSVHIIKVYICILVHIWSDLYHTKNA